MKKLKFEKGDFIAYNHLKDTFAIFEGEEYEESDGSTFYSLLVYYCPTHLSFNKNANDYKTQYVFDCTIKKEECEYSLTDDNLNHWHKCNDKEIVKFIEKLDERNLYWSFKKKKLFMNI